MKEWKFTDPKNVAVITTQSVVNDRQPILFVSRDNEDGGWQFHNGNEPNEKEALIVGLSEIVKIDQSVNELSDLPIGWIAWRDSKDTSWQRKKNQGRAV